jgi:hypothetical protein
VLAILGAPVPLGHLTRYFINATILKLEVGGIKLVILTNVSLLLKYHHPINVLTHVQTAYYTSAVVLKTTQTALILFVRRLLEVALMCPKVQIIGI